MAMEMSEKRVDAFLLDNWKTKEDDSHEPVMMVAPVKLNSLKWCGANMKNEYWIKLVNGDYGVQYLSFSLEHPTTMEVLPCYAKSFIPMLIFIQNQKVVRFLLK